jgi:alkaline phosphatase D
VWNILGNQTVLTPAPVAVGSDTFYNLDQWDGYPAARSRLLDVLADGVTNPVVITGDIHTAAVSEVPRQPADPGAGAVAVELVGTSISTAFRPELVDLTEAAGAANPFTRYINPRQRGYVRCELTPGRLRADFRVVADPLVADSDVSTDATFEITAGTSAVRRL